MTRFSTWPSAPTRITSARPGPSATNSMWRTAPSLFGASTSPAAADSPDSMEDVVGQRLLQGAAAGLQRAADLVALILAQLAELQQPVHEQPQPAVGRQAAGGGVGGEQQPGIGQVRHHAADRGRGERHRQAARQGAAAHRLRRSARTVRRSRAAPRRCARRVRAAGAPGAEQRTIPSSGRKLGSRLCRVKHRRGWRLRRAP